MTKWTKEMDDQLDKLVASGASYLEVAADLGVTRNAVTSRVTTRKHQTAIAAMAGGTPPAAPALPPGDPQLRATERKLKESQAQVRTLRAALDEADAKKTIAEQLIEVVQEEVQPWEPRPLALPKPAEALYDVDMIAPLADEHSDLVISGASTWGLERYDFNVFRIRLERYAKVLAAYMRHHLPRYAFKRLWTFSMGDKVHGNLPNSPGQKYRNFHANDLRAAIAVAEAEADWLARMLDHVQEVVWVGVSGNHARQTAKKDYADPHDNLDFLVTAYIAARMRNYVEEGRLTIHAPRSWTAYVDVRGRTNALNHGDDVTGTWGIPWYGFSKKENRVQSLVAQKDQRVDFFWYGHFHSDTARTENMARSIHAGNWFVTDPYALNKLAAGGEPVQQAQVFDDELGRILEIPVYVRDTNREDAYWRGLYLPTIGRDSSLTTVAMADELAETGEFPMIMAGA